MLPRYVPLAVAIFLLLFIGGIVSGPITAWNSSIPHGILFILAGVLVIMINSSFRVMVRDAGKTVLMDSGHRESSHGLTPLSNVELGDDAWPPMQLYLVGGGSAYYFSIKDRNAVQARSSAIESFGEDVILVYAPTQPLPGYFVKALAPHEADQLEKANQSGFISNEKSDSLLHYSLLDTLHGIDSQSLRQQQAFLVNRHGKAGSDEVVRVRKGREAIITDFRNLATAARSRTKKESILRFWRGEATTDDIQKQADKERVQ